MVLEVVLEMVLETVLETMEDWVAVEMAEVGWVWWVGFGEFADLEG